MAEFPGCGPGIRRETRLPGDAALNLGCRASDSSSSPNYRSLCFRASSYAPPLGFFFVLRSLNLMLGFAVAFFFGEAILFRGFQVLLLVGSDWSERLGLMLKITVCGFSECAQLAGQSY